MPDSGLGLLRQRDLPVLRRGGQVVTVTPEIRAFFNEPKTLIVTKANVKSRVHRRVYMDYIGVKRFNADGMSAGEFRIVGLFTSAAYTRPPRTIPYLRRKIDAIVRRAGFDPDGHSGKALVNVLETYPRDELFQIDEDTLYRFALAIMQIEERPRVRVLARRDRFDRFVSVLVYVPRERYDTRVRQAIGEYLAGVYQRARQRVLSVRSRKARWSACISSSDATPARRRIRTARRWRRRSPRSSAPGRDALAEALREVVDPGAPARCSSAIATRSRTATARSIRRSKRWPTSASSKDCRRIVRSRRFLPQGLGQAGRRRPRRCGATAGRSRCRSACRCSRTWASGWSTSAPTRSTPPAGEPESGSTT